MNYRLLNKNLKTIKIFGVMERRDVMVTVRREKLREDAEPEVSVYLLNMVQYLAESQSKKHGPGIKLLIEINLTS